VKAPGTRANEAERVGALHGYEVLDTEPEPSFDALTALAASILDVPIALVSLVDTDRQWFKSRYGLDASETPRDVSFCGHVVEAGAATERKTKAFLDEVENERVEKPFNLKNVRGIVRRFVDARKVES